MLFNTFSSQAAYVMNSLCQEVLKALRLLDDLLPQWSFQLGVLYNLARVCRENGRELEWLEKQVQQKQLVTSKNCLDGLQSIADSVLGEAVVDVNELSQACVTVMRGKYERQCLQLYLHWDSCLEPLLSRMACAVFDKVRCKLLKSKAAVLRRGDEFCQPMAATSVTLGCCSLATLLLHMNFVHETLINEADLIKDILLMESSPDVQLLRQLSHKSSAALEQYAKYLEPLRRLHATTPS